jgi:hypothetical protein
MHEGTGIEKSNIRGTMHCAFLTVFSERNRAV